jgi:hypothetical protein
VANAPRRNYCQDHLNDLNMVFDIRGKGFKHWRNLNQ